MCAKIGFSVPYRCWIDKVYMNCWRHILFITIKSYCLFKNYCIQETKHLLTHSDSSTNTKNNLLVRQNLPQNCAAILKPLWAKVFKFETISFNNFSPRTPKIQKVLTLNFSKWGEKTFKQSKQLKKYPWFFFFCYGDCTPFMSKSCQMWDHFFPLLFPKDSKNQKFLDIRLQEVGQKDV